MNDLTLTELLAGGLGAWRLAWALVVDRGPAGVLLKIREMVGITHDDAGIPAGAPETSLALMFSCVWCMTFWTALLALAGILWAPWVFYPFAIWGAAGAAHSWLGGKRD